MFQLDLKSRKSIYEQIVDGCKEMIICGDLEPNEKLPSVREMSALLTVNPNTGRLDLHGHRQGSLRQRRTPRTGHKTDRIDL